MLTTFEYNYFYYLQHISNAIPLFDFDLNHLIIMYIVDPPTKLLDWIDPTKLYWSQLSKNIAAISYLEQHMNYINWYYLSTNPSAIYLIEQHLDLVNWGRLSKNPAAGHIINSRKFAGKGVSYWLAKNPAAIEYVVDNFNQLCKYAISRNTAAIPLLHKYPNMIHWYGLSKNPAAIHILENPKNIHHLFWAQISMNPAAINLLKLYPEHINWDNLSRNSAAIELLMLYPEKINWEKLCANSEAIHLIESYIYAGNELSSFGWSYLSKNPAIFKPDYTEISRIYAKYRDLMYNQQ